MRVNENSRLGKFATAALSVLACVATSSVGQAYGGSEREKPAGEGKKVSTAERGMEQKAMKEGKTHMDEKAYHSGVVEFQPQMAELTADDKEKIKSMVETAKENGELERVSVAVWSDKEFPAPEGQSFTEEDRALTQERIDLIESYLKEDLNVSGVETFHMGKESNRLAQFFNTDEAELKSIFAKKEGEPLVSQHEFQSFRDEGGASQAVIWLAEKPSSASTSEGTSSSESEGQLDQGYGN